MDVYRALLDAYRTLLDACRNLLDASRALFDAYRALLDAYRVHSSVNAMKLAPTTQMPAVRHREHRTLLLEYMTRKFRALLDA